jgi:ankyrin repeat protein
VLVILEAGRNTEATNVAGQTPLHVAVKGRRVDNVTTLLLWERNIEATNNIFGDTPLHVAALDDSEDIVKTLLE